MLSPISFTKESGYSDVDDIMMVTIVRCWEQNHSIGDFFKSVGLQHLKDSLPRVST